MPMDMATDSDTDNAAIRTIGLTKRFGTLAAVDDLSLEVPRASVYGFLGPNGAGKTTTLRMLLGLARPTSGRAEVLGHDVVSDRAAAVSAMAYVPGEFAVWPSLRGSEMLDLLGSLRRDRDSTRRTELCERFEFDPTRRGREYSKGNRQKIALIAALSSTAPVLILDEPTSGLDPLMERTFRDCIDEERQAGRTVLLSSHILSEVEAVCDRVAIIRSGRLVDSGTLDDLRAVGARDVHVVFESPPTIRLEELDGVSEIVIDGSEATFHLRGSPDGLIAALAGHRLVSLDIREPSLEELFLGFYGSTDPGSR